MIIYNEDAYDGSSMYKLPPCRSLVFVKIEIFTNILLLTFFLKDPVDKFAKLLMIICNEDAYDGSSMYKLPPMPQ